MDYQKKWRQLVKNNSLELSFGLFALVGVALLTSRILVTSSMRFVFLYWNLLLAVVPLVLAYWLVSRIKKYGWFRWEQIGITFLWLSFLPNSFYVITDMVHLRANYEASLYFDVVLLASFMLCGLFLGFYSIFLVHRELIKRFSNDFSMYLIALVLLLCSFATYLGRFTRWNSWDILLQPFGLLFDISDRLVNPTQHNDTYLATITFFLVLFSAYLVVWNASKRR